MFTKKNGPSNTTIFHKISFLVQTAARFGLLRHKHANVRENKQLYTNYY